MDMLNKAVEIRKIAQLILECQKRLDDYDSERLAENKYRRSVCGPSLIGQELTQTICTDNGVPEIGELIYYLNAYTWNDVQIWATNILATINKKD
jgi:hypothetical protein